MEPPFVVLRFGLLFWFGLNQHLLAFGIANLSILSKYRSVECLAIRHWQMLAQIEQPKTLFWSFCYCNDLAPLHSSDDLAAYKTFSSFFNLRQ